MKKELAVSTVILVSLVLIMIGCAAGPTAQKGYGNDKLLPKPVDYQGGADVAGANVSVGQSDPKIDALIQGQQRMVTAINNLTLAYRESSANGREEAPSGPYSKRAKENNGQKTITADKDINRRLSRVEKDVRDLKYGVVEQALFDSAQWAVMEHPNLFTDYKKVHAVRVAKFGFGQTEIPCVSQECGFRTQYRRVLDKMKKNGWEIVLFLGYAYKDGDEKNPRIGLARAEHIKLAAKELSVYLPAYLEPIPAKYAYETKSFGVATENLSGVVIFAKK